ncbi:MAG TPA: ATP-binding protein [Pseudosphingobacterium sp.]|nr:ATP-binding protein [Pseudosphingobacterium sp.]
MKNIVFIGGIHGSGKGEICRLITSKTDFMHLTASEVLKWDELSTKEEKLVANIDITQNRLISNLRSIIERDEKYLLDGHYCLLNKNGTPERVPIQTFRDIDPAKLVLVTADPQAIKHRLENRDSKTYDVKLIEEFQCYEIDFAMEISKNLQIPLFKAKSEKLEVNNLLNFLK